MRIYVVATALLLGMLGASADASPTPGQNAGETRMSEYSATRPPIGYLQFCRQNPNDCRSGQTLPQRYTLTPTRLQELAEVNDLVNRAIAPVTDRDLYGVAEMWTYPLDRGDCEDYVLLKRRVLLERGWPASALLITVVRDTNGDGHAVLTVRTDQGDFVLDNLVGKVMDWRDTRYRYLKRQSTANAGKWVDIIDDRPNIVAGNF